MPATTPAATLDTTWVIDPSRSTLGFTVDVTTLDTGNALRDRRLHGAEYFDAGRHPEIRFTSGRIERLGRGELRIKVAARSSLAKTAARR